MQYAPKVLEGLKDALEGEEVLPIAARIVAQFMVRSRQTILSSDIERLFRLSTSHKPRSRRKSVIDIGVLVKLRLKILSGAQLGS